MQMRCHRTQWLRDPRCRMGGSEERWHAGREGGAADLSRRGVNGMLRMHAG